jgi:hypothetical protein
VKPNYLISIGCILLSVNHRHQAVLPDLEHLPLEPFSETESYAAQSLPIASGGMFSASASGLQSHAVPHDPWDRKTDL